MSTMAPEVEIVEDPDQLELPFEFEDFEIPCEIAELSRHLPGGWPKCPGDPATWVAWRVGCCTAAPRFRLVCDHCKEVYQNWAAHQAVIVCPGCDTETGGYISYTPLKKSS